jgi:ABC-type lipoprotein release transport system permease subunit
MTIYIQLAWRNIWRNKRRTIITGASVFFGVVFSSIMTSMQEGSYDRYIQTIVHAYSGHIQLHRQGYWDNKIINNSLTCSDSMKTKIGAIKSVTVLTPRLESYALASGEELTKGVMVMGISPDSEDSITRLSEKMISGEYLKPGDSGVIIGSGLARYMQLDVNDSLVLLSQGYHGASAAGLYRVKGILKHPSPDFDRSTVYMDIGQCQQLFSAPERLTSLVIMTKSNDDVDAVKKALANMTGSSYEVMDWKDINKIMLTQIEGDRASGIIIKGVLYLIIAFGIFGTIMMMTLERRKEFGVLIAVGMQKFRLSNVLFTETIMIGLLGSLSGIAASIPIAWFYLFHPIRFTGQAAETMLQMGFEPIMTFSLMPAVFYRQALTILFFTILIGIYPVLFTKHLNVNQALHS